MSDARFETERAPRLSRESADLLIRQVAQAAARSVPLPDVLEALADDAGERRLAVAAHRLADRLRAGATIDEALAAEKGAFPPHVRGILSAGVRANNVPVVLEGYAALALQRRNIKSTVRSALAYPILVAILLVPVLLLLALYLAPMFEELFNADFRSP